MKKIALLLFTAIYVVAVLGVTVHFFYCCHRLAAVSITQSEPNVPCTKMEKKGCCSNHSLTIKITSDQHLNDGDFHLPTVPIFQAWPQIAFGFIPQQEFFHPILNSTCRFDYQLPPPLGRRRQALFCLFRI